MFQNILVIYIIIIGSLIINGYLFNLFGSVTLFKFLSGFIHIVCTESLTKVEDRRGRSPLNPYSPFPKKGDYDCAPIMILNGLR